LTLKSTTKTNGSGLSRRQVLVVAPLLLGVHGLSDAQELSALEKIKARGVLKVAVYKENAPYSDGPNADMQGVDVSLAKALAAQLNLQLALLPFDAGENMNDDLRNMVWKGHYLGYGPADVMIHVPVDRYLMNENKQVLIFGSYVREHLVVLHDPAKVPHVDNPDDLQGKTIAVEKGSGAASALMGYRGGLLRDKISIFKDGVDAAKMVTSGQFDAAFVSRAQAESAVYAASGKGRWVLSSVSLPGVMPAGWPLGLAVKSDNKDLATALDNALASLRQSGELLKIFQSHGLTLAAP
jgi:polar amino acid transport system substrate-binding protein